MAVIQAQRIEGREYPLTWLLSDGRVIDINPRPFNTQILISRSLDDEGYEDAW